MCTGKGGRAGEAAAVRRGQGLREGGARCGWRPKGKLRKERGQRGWRPEGSCGKELGFWSFYTMRGLLEPSDQGIDGQI